MTATTAPPAGSVEDGRPVRGGRVVAAVGVLTLATFAAVTAETLPVGLLPMIARGLGTDESRVGLLVSAYAVVVATMSLPLTALLARWSRRSALVVLLGAYALGNAVFAGTDDYAVAVAARLVAGLAHAGFFSVAVGSAVSLVPPERAGRVTAWLFGGVTLAFTVGVPAGTAFGTAFGWRWAFVAVAALLLLLAAFAVALLPAAAPPAAAEPVPMRHVLRRGPVVLIALTTVVLTLGHYTAFTYIAPLLRSAGITEGDVSLVLFGYGIAGALGLALAGALSDRFPRRTLLALPVLVAVSLAALGVAGTSVALVVGATVLWGIAFGAQPTLLQIAARRAAPDAGDLAPGLSNATTNVGIAGGGLIGGRELLAADPSVLALTGAGLAVAALALVLLAPRRRNGPG